MPRMEEMYWTAGVADGRLRDSRCAGPCSDASEERGSNVAYERTLRVGSSCRRDHRCRMRQRGDLSSVRERERELEVRVPLQGGLEARGRGGAGVLRVAAREGREGHGGHRLLRRPPD